MTDQPTDPLEPILAAFRDYAERVGNLARDTFAAYDLYKHKHEPSGVQWVIPFRLTRFANDRGYLLDWWRVRGAGCAVVMVGRRGRRPLLSINTHTERCYAGDPPEVLWQLGPWYGGERG